MNENTFESKVKELLELEALAKEIEKQKEQLKAELKAELESKGQEEVHTSDGHKVSWKECFSNRLDSKKIKAELPDIYNKYLSINVTRRFSIA